MSIHKTIISLIGLPFAYNGPCATISGCGKIYNRTRQKYHDKNVYFSLIEQNFNQSPRQYLNDIYKILSKEEISRTVFIGGNHLSVLPLHKYAKQESLISVIFDAHRDYNTDSQSQYLSHADFLSVFDDLSDCIIFGCRDNNCHSFRGCKTFEINQKSAFLRQIDKLKKKGYDFYLDIDVDVLDPKIFPATECPLNNGITPDELLEIINHIEFTKIRYISIEEFIPYLGSQKCDDIIDDLIDSCLSGWSRLE